MLDSWKLNFVFDPQEQ